MADSDEGGLVPSNSAQEKDAALIKSVFKDKEDFLLQIRALFLGVPLLDDEKVNIKNVFSNPDLMDLFNRRFLPDVSGSRNNPIGQVQDVMLGAEQMVFGAPALQIEQATRYKARAIEFTKHALVLLTNPDGVPVPYKYSTYEEDPMQIDLMARNMFISHVDKQLMMLHLIANQKPQPTEKEQGVNRLRNSNR